MDSETFSERRKRERQLFFRPTERFCKQLGEHISLARRKRGYTQKQMAEKVVISLSTYRKMEQGDGSISMETFLRVLFVLDGLHSFDGLLSSNNDQLGLDLMEDQLPKRVRRKKTIIGNDERNH